MSGVGIFFLILFLLLLIGGGSWIAYTRIRAQRLGLPPPPLNPFASRSRSSGGGGVPSPAPSGVIGWFNDKLAALKSSRKGGPKNSRYASGAGYEETGHGGPRRATLDPDEAWDSRVGNEADYGYGYEEEQELGLRDPATPYGASAGGAGTGGYAGAGMYAAPGSGGGGAERGRSRSRELDERYDEEMGARSGYHAGGGGGGGGGLSSDPFGDHAERSDLRGVSPRPLDHHKAGGAAGNSPTESRRSLFREEV